MTLQEIINNIRDLGFSDDAEMQDFGDLVYNSINRAVSIINLELAPVIATYTIEQDGTDEDYNYYDMRSLTKKNGKETFLTFGDTPVMIENSDGVSYSRFNDFDIEQESILVFKPDTEGTFKVFYKKLPAQYTATSEGTTELDLPLRVHHLVPLLAAYYVWLEDEPTKAAQYYNLYEQGANEIREQSAEGRVRMRVLPGGM